MKDTYYFSHDYNTRTDVKIKRIIAKHGMLGYGVFWSIIEDLYNNANALPTDYNSIAYDLRVDEIIVESIVNDFDLFIIENEYFGSLSVQRRIDERNKKSLEARKSANKRWGKVENDANALPTQSEPNAIKEIKVNESKEEEIKETENKIKKDIPIGTFDFDFEKLKDKKMDSLDTKGCCDDFIKYYKVSEAFRRSISNKIQTNGGSIKAIGEAKVKSWVKPIRDMYEVDKLDKDSIAKVYNWLPTSDFWSKNILSTSKLREKFNTLILEANKQTNSFEQPKPTVLKEIKQPTLLVPTEEEKMQFRRENGLL